MDFLKINAFLPILNTWMHLAKYSILHSDMENHDFCNCSFQVWKRHIYFLDYKKKRKNSCCAFVHTHVLFFSKISDRMDIHSSSIKLQHQCFFYLEMVMLICNYFLIIQAVGPESCSRLYWSDHHRKCLQTFYNSLLYACNPIYWILFACVNFYYVHGLYISKYLFYITI